MVNGVTNLSPPDERTHRTEIPLHLRSRTKSGALKAAIPPETIRSTFFSCTKKFPQTKQQNHIYIKTLYYNAYSYCPRSKTAKNTLKSKYFDMLISFFTKRNTLQIKNNSFDKFFTQGQPHKKGLSNRN